MKYDFGTGLPKVITHLNAVHETRQAAAKDISSKRSMRTLRQAAEMLMNSSSSVLLVPSNACEVSMVRS